MFGHLNRHKKVSRRSGLIYLLFGISLLLIFSGYRFHQARILSFFTKETPQITTQRTGVVPVYIKSYPLGVEIKIKESSVQNGVWQVFPDAVSHLDSSARIGESGNMILYGHNKDDVLGPIRHARIGGKIELKGSDGKTYGYEVVKTDTVDPNNLEYILPKSEEVLTLYTCTGFLDSKRFVVVAKRIKS